jgi:uncharacterized protein DUF397
VKSPYSNSSGNCVDVTMRPYGDEDHVVVSDTKSKTGKGVILLFTRDEWDAFLRAAKEDLFDWDVIDYDRDRPITRGERARLEQKFAQGLARTPENLAYVNGRHAERAGWVPTTFERFCKKYHHSENEPRSRSLYEAFMTGRRAEAHDRSISQENRS